MLPTATKQTMSEPGFFVDRRAEQRRVGQYVSMRVTVNMDVCESNGLCVGIAPTVFEIDDNDVLQLKVADVPEELAASVVQAARACPKQAISIEH
jgi:ferredoxin